MARLKEGISIEDLLNQHNYPDVTMEDIKTAIGIVLGHPENIEEEVGGDDKHFLTSKQIVAGTLHPTEGVDLDSEPREQRAKIKTRSE